MKNGIIRKSACLLLAMAFAVSMTACGKPSAKKLNNAVSKKLDVEEVKLEDLEDMEGDEIQDAVDDGILVHTNGEEIADVFEDELEDVDFGEIGDQIDIDLDDWDVEDIKDATIYSKVEGMDSKSTAAMSTSEIAYVIEFEDSKKSDELFTELMDKFEDLADDQLDIDIEKLSKDEYMNKGNKGHLVLNIDSNILVDALIDQSEEMTGQKVDKEQKKEIQKAMGDSKIIIAIYYDSGVLTMFFGSGDDDFENISTLAKALGIKDPLTIENSDEMIDGISSIFSFGIGSYLSRARAAAAEIQEHNENVQAVVDEIESEVDDN